MTGYGKSSQTVGTKKIMVEIKSLNSKQMDLSTRVPSLFREKDIEIRSMITKALTRGKVDMFMTIEDTSSSIATKINKDAVESYCNQIKEISSSVGLQQPDFWSVVIRLPEVLKTDNVEELSDEMWNAAKKAVDEAVAQLVEFRKQEGAQLEKIFTEKISNIGARLKEVELYDKDRVEKIKARLRDNLETLTKDYDKNRFEQELIFYIEKLDISEEKNRLSNHLQYFMKTMETEEAPGKKLGFIAQEIGREVNTLGSKSNQSEMQILVVKMKDELEQIKEQVLNTL